jgi:TonB family protein
MKTAILAGIMAIVDAAALAQGVATVRGAISDPSGARVPGAAIRILDKSNSLASTVSGPDGSYELSFPVPQGAPANLLLQVEKPGFVRSERGISKPAPNMIEDLQLKLGQIRETMSIEGRRPVSTVSMTPSGASAPQRIRVGGNVQAASLLRRTAPEYPQALKDRGVEGTVELEAVISKEGNVLSLYPRSKLVDAGLIEASMQAVKTWQYKPTLLNGEPVDVVTVVTVRFYLQ